MTEDTKNKLIELERRVAQEKGSLVLFALVLREDETNKWDFLAASDWLQQDKEGGLRYLAENLQKTLTPEELLSLSRIFILPKGHPYLNLLLGALPNCSGSEFEECRLGPLYLKHVYMIRLSHDPAWVPQKTAEDIKQTSKT
jgi:hypothetical protein